MVETHTLLTNCDNEMMTIYRYNSQNKARHTEMHRLTYVKQQQHVLLLCLCTGCHRQATSDAAMLGDKQADVAVKSQRRQT